jgi:phospholipid/cholesterol/gamma-HCH transport system ATP-binding protein
VSRVEERPTLVFENVVKSFGPKTVLGDLSLTVRTGETMVVLGPSGSGKSVLLKLAVGLLRPDSGRITIVGQDITGMAENRLYGMRQKVAMVFQGGALFDSMSVGENVAFALREHTTMDESAIGRRVMECLGMVNLDGAVRMMPAEISGGMKKRVALARAVALEPEMILYDEPTSGLDPVVAGRINRLIRSLQQRLGITSVVVTHDIDSAAFVGDRIAWLLGGRIDFVGSMVEARRVPPGPMQDFLQAGEERR